MGKRAEVTFEDAAAQAAYALDVAGSKIEAINNGHGAMQYQRHLELADRWTKLAEVVAEREFQQAINEYNRTDAPA